METKINFTRISYDINGNPRYVVHYLHISKDYARACKLANNIGGRKFHNKQYGGGIVFGSVYNLKDLERRIVQISETLNQ